MWVYVYVGSFLPVNFGRSSETGSFSSQKNLWVSFYHDGPGTAVVQKENAVVDRQDSNVCDSPYVVVLLVPLLPGPKPWIFVTKNHSVPTTASSAGRRAMATGICRRLCW